MKHISFTNLGVTLAGVLALIVTSARADSFGTAGYEFTMDFVDIGNAGNADDAGAGGGLYSAPYGGVSYEYRMGTYEISQDAITKATASGLANVAAGAWGATQPAANMTWYEMAAFVNFLNTSTGHQAAYQINAGVTALTLWSSAQAWQLDGENLYRHKDAYYFLPSEDEWYKAAYHKNDGVTANYWDYTTASNTVPTAVVSGTGGDTAVVNNVTASPAAVNDNGGLSAYGTRGQGGNIFEWMESAADGVNDSPSEPRRHRGSSYDNPDSYIRSAQYINDVPTDSSPNFGFRVASVVPEPSCAVLVIGSGLVFILKRRRARSL